MATPPTRIAQGQGIYTLRIGTRANLPDDAAYASGAASAANGSCIGGPIVTAGFYHNGGVPYPTATGGRAARLTGDSIADIILGSDPAAGGSSLQSEWVAIGNTLIGGSVTYTADVVTAFIATIPASGNATVPVASPHFAFVGAGSSYDYMPPQAVLMDAGGTTRAMLAADHTLGSGLIAALDTTGPSVSTFHLWQGYDAYINASGIGPAFAVLPDVAGAKNWLLFSGVNLGSTDRPLLISANLDGTENGRWLLKLDNPALDAVFAQPVATHSIYSIMPCDVGWIAAISIVQANPPTLIAFNADCSRYWVYVLVGVDDNAIAALFNTGFGRNGFERLYLQSVLTDLGDGGELSLIGVGDTAQTRTSVLINQPRSVLLPPFPPVLTLPCVPCAPLSIDGNSWAGRLS